MTAILILRRRDAIDLLCDGAVYDAHGVVRGIGSKVYRLGERAIVSGRGQMAVASVFARAAAMRFGASASPLDALLSGFGDFMAEFSEAGRHALGAEAFADHEIIVAGWSADRGRPEVYAAIGGAASGSADGKPVPPGALVELGPLTWAGAPGAFAPIEAPYLVEGGFIDEGRLEGFDPETEGLAAFEAARRWRGPLGRSGHVGHGVGGLVERVTVTRLGITRRVLRWWPEDQVGRPIVPQAESRAAA